MQATSESSQITTDRDNCMNIDNFLVPEHFYIGNTTIVVPKPDREKRTSPYDYWIYMFRPEEPEDPFPLTPGEHNGIRAFRSLALFPIDDLLFVLKREELPGQTIVQYRLEPIMQKVEGGHPTYTELHYDNQVRIERGLVFMVQGQQVSISHPLDGDIPTGIPHAYIQELQQTVLHDFQYGPCIYDQRFLDLSADILVYS